MALHRWKILLGLGFFGIGLLGLADGAFAAKPLPSDQRALSIVSQRTGIPTTELTIRATATTEYPLSGLVATEYKVEDPAGESYGVVVGPFGEELDAETLESQEARLYASRYGTLDQELFDTVAGLPSGSLVPVAFWLRVPDEESLARPLPGGQVLSLYGDAETQLKQADIARAASVGSVVQPLVDALRAAGYEADADPYAPAVHAVLPAGSVASWGASSGVDRVSLEKTLTGDLSVAAPAIGATNLWALGFTGAGVRLAQIEVGGRVELGNPFLAGVTLDAANVCAAPSGHSTAVAGILVSSHPTQRGIAFGSTLRAYGSCNGRDNELRRGASAAADWGAAALNMSFGRDDGGRLGAQDRFYDDMVQNRWRTIVVSAGNNAGGFGTGTSNVGSPGTAYNVLTVGATTHDHAGVAVFSSWRDPGSTHRDREKPEVGAPGENIVTLGLAAPWLNPSFSGTSAAAPVTTGAVGLVLQTNPTLSVWPETIKALFMATARNIGVPQPLSEFVGAGGIDVNLAAQVARGQAGGFGGRSYTCGASKNTDVAWMNLTAGVPARMAIAWDQNPNFLFYASRPSADLDLRVLDPGGALVARSNSYDNTYEMVQFTPARTGRYTLRVYKDRCSLIIPGSNPRWLGWAWFQTPTPPARRGMTWTKVDHNFAFGTDRFNCSGCNAYQGETLCSEAHQVLCHRPDGSPNPGLPVNGNDGWVGGNIGLSPAIRGDQLLSLANANAVCSNFFGPGWAMAEFHHPLGGWGWSSHGNVQAPNGSRFWTYINDQAANCWN